MKLADKSVKTSVMINPNDKSNQPAIKTIILKLILSNMEKYVLSEKMKYHWLKRCHTNLLILGKFCIKQLCQINAFQKLTNAIEPFELMLNQMSEILWKLQLAVL